MMVAGFKSVVGTMWALDDTVGPKVAKKFYEEMYKSLDESTRQHQTGAERAAMVLERTLIKMHADFPFMQRINLVHYGI